MDGWIKLYRKILDHEVFKSKDDKLFKVFIYCLLRANHKPTEVFFNKQKVGLKAGQFITGRDQASRELGFSPKTFDRKIHDLQNGTILTRYMTRRFSIISITNWDTYQGRPEENGPLHDPKHDPLNGTNLTTDKKYKEVKKNIYSQNSLEVLFYLNNKTGRHYRDASNIEARLKDGGTVEDCKGIIDKKLKDDHFIKNPKFLNPETLFRKSHWDNYLNECVEISKPAAIASDSLELKTQAALREMATIQAVPCPPGLKPDFLKEVGS